jgi:hypothetical protein
MNIDRMIRRTTRNLGIAYFDDLCSKLKLSAHVNLLLGKPKTIERSTSYLTMLLAITISFAIKAALLSVVMISFVSIFATRLLVWSLNPKKINVEELKKELDKAIYNYTLIEDLLDNSEAQSAINIENKYNGGNILLEAVEIASKQKINTEKHKIQLKIIELLIKNNADVESVNIYHQSVLFFARGDLLKRLAPLTKRYATPRDFCVPRAISSTDASILKQHKLACLNNFKEICIVLSQKFATAPGEEAIFIKTIKDQAEYFFPGNLSIFIQSTKHAVNIYRSVENVYIQRRQPLLINQ